MNSKRSLKGNAFDTCYVPLATNVKLVLKTPFSYFYYNRIQLDYVARNRHGYTRKIECKSVKRLKK